MAHQRILFVCQGTGCVSGKSVGVYEALKAGVERHGLSDVKVDFSGCHGFCEQGPIVAVEPEGTFYCHVGVEDASEIVTSHLRDGKPVERLFYRDPVSGEAIPLYHDIPFYKKQQRVILHRCGHINPERIDDYIAAGGYQAIRKALLEMTPEKVIQEITRSGLRGRGGAGFPTGQKWRFCRSAPGDIKYLICNADEGDPGAFMDRSILEADPFSVLEGMTIAGYAIGASEGYIYVRAEYPLAIRRFSLALEQSQERGLLGENILDSGFNFTVHIKEGAGAFVCGEETALMMSIEGRRGMPRPRPPFPAQSGLWGKPTIINNVKTLASTAAIIARGADWFSSLGTGMSKGTAVFALTGKIANSGLVEVPMGIPLSDIIFEIGGGILGGKQFKAVQTGGPSGGCIPAQFLNAPVEYETLSKLGSMMGSGGMVVMDESSCMVDMAKFFLHFTQEESCGKCTFCRIGTLRMLEILERITEGKGKEGDMELLEELAGNIKKASLCGLGQTAPNPVLTTLKYFRHEYEAHILEKRCPAKKCQALIRYEIIPDKCPGCGLCAKYCPAGAISGEKKKPHVIALDKCVHCGLCLSSCRLGAVLVS